MINIHQRLVEAGLKQLQLTGKLIPNCIVIFQEEKFLISFIPFFFLNSKSGRGRCDGIIIRLTTLVSKRTNWEDLKRKSFKQV
jgi:hypothetical protein